MYEKFELIKKEQQGILACDKLWNIILEDQFDTEKLAQLANTG
jgi:hypothetical protein